MTLFARAIARPPGTDVEFKLTSLSFMRMFGPGIATPVSANQWVPIILDPQGEPWRLVGEACWEWIPPEDPDHDLSAAGVRCLKEGIYSFSGALVFDSAQQTGDRAINITTVKGPYAHKWNLVASQSMPKVANAGLLVAGEAYQYAGDIVELQAYSTVNTSTISNPLLVWLSATLIGAA